VNKQSRQSQIGKKVLRQSGRLTRPPRMEGVVKEAMMQPVRKKKRIVLESPTPEEKYGYTDRQRKDYQLRSKKH